MATAKYGTASALGSNIAGATLDALGNGLTSAFITYDNSTNRDLYAFVLLELGSITPSVGGSVTLRVFYTAGGTTPDNTGAAGGGDPYTQVLIPSVAAAKAVVFKISLGGPVSLRLCVTNNAGVALAGSANSLRVQPFNEDVS